MARNIKAGVVFVTDSKGVTKEIKLTRAELKKLNAEKEKGTNAFKKYSASATKVTKSLGAVAAGVTAVVGSTAFLASSISPIVVEYEKLNAQLKTVKGSSAAAGAEFKRLAAFAQSTPFSITQSIEAFTKLTNLGLNPSQIALRSYGNTATAMGKELTDFIEAAADASTNEFERLKEFGIKSKQEGDKVIFTFQGMKHEVDKTSQAIEKFLIGIGEVNFASAMSDQLDTLGAGLSNMTDAIDRATVRLSEKTGFTEAMKGASLAVAEFFNNVAKADNETDLSNRLDAVQSQIENINKALNSDKYKGRFADQAIVKSKLNELLKLEKDYQKRLDAIRDERAADRESKELASKRRQIAEDIDAIDKAVQAQIDAWKVKEPILEKEYQARVRLQENDKNLIEGIEFEIEMLGKSNEEREISTVLRKLSTEAGEDEARMLQGLVTQLAYQKKALSDSAAEQEKFNKVWERGAERIDDAFADMWSGTLRDFDSFKDRLLDAFKDMIAQMIHQQTTAKLSEGFSDWMSGSGGDGKSGGQSQGLSSITSNLGMIGAFVAAGLETHRVVDKRSAESGTLRNAYASSVTALPLVNSLLSDHDFESVFGGKKRLSRSELHLGIDEDGVEGQYYQKYKKARGLFQGRKTSRKYQELGELGESLNAGFIDSKAQIVSALQVMGQDIGDEIFDSFTLATKRIDVKGKDQEAVNELINEWVANLNNSLAQSVSDFDFDHLVNMSKSLTGVNKLLGLLNHTLLESSTNSALLAESLIGMAGGFENLTTLTAGYFDLFYSESEKAAENAEFLTSEFKKLGVRLPKTRDGVRKLVDGLDLQDEANHGLYLSILKLAPQLDSYVSSLEDLAAAEADRIAALEQQRSDSISTLQAEISSLASNFTGAANDANKFNTALERFNAAQSASSSIKGFMTSSNLGSNSILSADRKLELAQNNFNQLANLALSGDAGAANAAGQLTQSGSDLITVAKDNFASSPKYIEIFKATNLTLNQVARAMDSIAKPVQDDTSRADATKQIVDKLHDLAMLTGQGFEQLARSYGLDPFEDLGRSRGKISDGKFFTLDAARNLNHTIGSNKKNTDYFLQNYSDKAALGKYYSENKNIKSQSEMVDSLDALDGALGDKVTRAEVTSMVKVLSALEQLGTLAKVEGAREGVFTDSIQFKRKLKPDDFGFFADGGVVHSPTLAVIGEGGSSEAVIPLKGGAVEVKLGGTINTHLANLNEQIAALRADINQVSQTAENQRDEQIRVTRREISAGGLA